jgi:hypothetical protein
VFSNPSIELDFRLFIVIGCKSVDFKVKADNLGSKDISSNVTGLKILLCENLYFNNLLYFFCLNPHKTSAPSVGLD